MEYNSQRPKMIIPEYGRNIQKMVEFAVSVKDRDERNKVANAIISVMGQLNPQLRDIGDFKHKLWDHLFIISDFKLEVDSPYPIPDSSILTEKPDKVEYPNQKIKYKHYGKTIENMIVEASKYDEGAEKEVLVLTIANLMKKTYLIWNRDSVDDELIRKDLSKLSDGKLSLPESATLEATTEILSRNRRKRKSNNRPGKGKRKY